LGCNRGNAPDQPVSANSDQTGRSAEPQPNNTVQQPPAQTERQPAQEPRQAYRTPEKSASRPNPAETPRMRVTESVASGTGLTVTLADTISTDGNKEGDTFTAHLSQPIVVRGKVVADKGDRVTGHIKNLEEPGKVKGRARLELVLDEIRTSSGIYNLST